MDKLVPYHCAFLLDRAGASLHMALAWRRVGSCDYGVYLTRRPSEEEPSPMCTVFRASYTEKGEIEGFLVRDGWPSLNRQWDEDHARPGHDRPLVLQSDIEQFEALAQSFFSRWLESFGESQALSMLKKLGMGEAKTAGVNHSWRRILSSGLPAEIKKSCLPDVLSCAEQLEPNFLLSFVPFPERIGVEDSREPLLEAKMQMFFDLL